MDPSLTPFKRELRKLWEAEELDLTNESVVYAKRRTTLREFLINIAQSDHPVRVKDHTNSFIGLINAVGRDYFSILNIELNKQFTFSLYEDCKYIIETLEKSVSKIKFELTDQSFIAVLAQVAQTNTSVYTHTTLHYNGVVELYKDFIVINHNEITNSTLISDQKTLIPISNIACFETIC